MPLLLVLLLLAAPPALAQSPIPTLLLDEQPVAEPATQAIGGGFPDAVATDGTNFLIVSTTVLKFVAGGQVAMLVDLKGRPLLKTSIRLPSDGNDFTARVAWSGRVYLIVLGSYEGRTRGIRIGKSGNVLDATPIEIHARTPWVGSAETAVVWDGGQFVVTTFSGVLGRPPNRIATRVSESGEILQNDIDIGVPAIVWFGSAAQKGVTVFLWRDYDGTHSKAMNSAGVVGDTIDIVDVRVSSIIAADDGFLVPISSSDGIELQHLDFAGRPDRPRVRVPLNASGGFWIVPSGPSYLVIFRSVPDAAYQAVHINGNGDLLETPREVPPPEPPFPLIVSTGADTLLVWSIAGGPAGYDPPITLARPLDSTEAPVQVHRGYVSQYSPRVSWQGMQPVVSWNENGPHAQMIGAATAMRLAGDDDIAAAIASSPTATLDVFGRGGSLYSGFMRDALYALVGERDPVLVDPQTIDVRFVRAVWTGRDFIVVWAHGGLAHDAMVDILGARISADGTLTDGPHVIANAESLADVAIGSSSSQVLVVYQARGVAHGVRLDAYGAWPTDDITTLADLQFGAKPFSLASDGENFFVSWVNRGNREPNDWIAGRLIDANGHAISPLSGYSTGGEIKQMMATFWTGANYLIIWSRGPLQDFPPSDLWAARAAADGRLLDYPPVQIGAVGGLVTSISRGPAGQIAIAYTRDGRVYTRFIVPARQHSASHR